MASCTVNFDWLFYSGAITSKLDKLPAQYIQATYVVCTYVTKSLI